MAITLPRLPINMHQLKILGSIVALCCALSTTQGTAQNVLVVDAAGRPGSQFTGLQQAITAASPGDVLDVLPGAYSGFQTSKGIHILGRAGGLIEILATPGSNADAFIVSNIPAGQRFTMRNVRVPTFFTARAEFADCAGSIVLENCIVNSLTGATSSGRLDFIRCSSAHLIGCSIAIGAEQSFVTLTDCVAESFTFPSFLAPILLRNAHLTLSGSSSRGIQSQFLLDPSPGILSFDSDIVVAGDSSHVIETRVSPSSMTASPAISGTGTLLIDPSVTLISVNGAPTIDPRIIVTTNALPTLSTAGAPIGGSLQTELRTQAGDTYLLALGLAGTLQPVPGILGNLWLDFPALESVGVAGPSGVVTTMSIIPNSTQFLGLHISRQAIVRPVAGGPLRFSNPATFSIRL